MTNESISPKRSRSSRPTSYDVASLAGVSQSAVSRVFKPGASVSAKMRGRVAAAAAELGYRPRTITRGLVTRRSNVVAILTTSMSSLSDPDALVTLTRAFSRHNIRVLLFALDREEETDAVVGDMLQHHLHGVVTSITLQPPQLAPFVQAHIPVVLFNRGAEDSPATAVRCDEEAGERWLVTKLIEAGHRSFGIVRRPEDSFVHTQRTASVTGLLTGHGITDVTSVEGNFSYEGGRQGFADIMQVRGSNPDAVIAANDEMAIGCIDEARDSFGLAVPDELSVVGFGGMGQARYAAYDLTTISQPVERMTTAAVQMLLDRVKDPTLSSEIRLFAGAKIHGSSAQISPD